MPVSLEKAMPDFLERLRDCAKRGLTMIEAAEELGCTYESIWNYSRRYEIKFTHRQRRKIAGVGTDNYGPHRSQTMLRIMVPLPKDTFEKLHSLATANQTSLAEQVRGAVAKGLSL